MDFAYIISQVFTVLMYAVLFASYLAKKRPSILLMSLIAVVLNALAYIFLGAWTGLAMCAIMFARSLYSILDEKIHKNSDKITRRDIIALIIICVAAIAVTIPTYDGILSLMSVFGALLYTFSVWQKNPIVYKFFGIPVGVLWIIYNAYVRSLFGVILESVLLLVSAYGFFVAIREKKHGAKR